MSDCCDPVPYRRFFNDKEAARRLKRYRRRGLDDLASQIVGYMRERGVDDKTVLEIGGGVGDLQVELLKAGAHRTVNVELSSEYEEAARELLEAERMSDRVERRVGDFVAERRSVDPADLVVLNRVICCYPWMEKLVSASVEKTRWLLAVAVPRDSSISRLLVRAGNGVNRLTGSGFQSFVHSVDEIEEVVTRSHLNVVFTQSGLVWQAMVFERS